MSELLARMQALLRRGRTNTLLRLRMKDLHMDVVTRKVKRAGRRIDLTAREFDLLEYLLRHVRDIVSREMLARDIWRDVGRTTPLDNVIDVHIACLRRKIDSPNLVHVIHTVRGVGFCLQLLINGPLARAIGDGSRDARTSTSREGFDPQKVRCHRAALPCPRNRSVRPAG